MYTLNDLASQVTAGTMKREEAQVCFLNYCSTNPDTSIVYYASDMIIWGGTNAAYLVASKARSRNTAYIFMGNKDQNCQIINRPIIVIAKIWSSDLILADKNAPCPYLQKCTFPFWLLSCRRHPGPGNQHRLHFSNRCATWTTQLAT